MFKYKKDLKNYTYMHPLTIMIMLKMHLYCVENNLPFIVTDTVSSKNEDEKLGRVSASHRESRAFDLSVKGWSNQDIKDFENYWNNSHEFVMYGYYSLSGKKRLAYFHEGTAPHFHVAIHKKYAKDKPTQYFNL